MDEEDRNILDLIDYVKSGEKRTANFLGHDFIIEGGVFPFDSPFSCSSRILAEQIPDNPGKVLDIGTGTGVQAIIAAKKGAESVLAVDISSEAVYCAMRNRRLQGYDHRKIEILKGNLFERCPLIERGSLVRYDLIIADLPFTDLDQDIPFNIGGLEMNLKSLLFDPGFKTHDRLLSYGHYFLELGGSILLTGGEYADESRLCEIADRYDYAIEEKVKEQFNGFEWKVYELKPEYYLDSAHCFFARTTLGNTIFSED